MQKISISQSISSWQLSVMYEWRYISFSSHLDMAHPLVMSILQRSHASLGDSNQHSKLKQQRIPHSVCLRRHLELKLTHQSASILGPHVARRGDVLLLSMVVVCTLYSKHSSNSPCFCSYLTLSTKLSGVQTVKTISSCWCVQKWSHVLGISCCINYAHTSQRKLFLVIVYHGSFIFICIIVLHLLCVHLHRIQAGFPNQLAAPCN